MRVQWEKAAYRHTDLCRCENWLNTDTYIRELFQMCRSAGDKNKFGGKKRKKELDS